jgi:hypothetical protein
MPIPAPSESEIIHMSEKHITPEIPTIAEAGQDNTPSIASGNDAPKRSEAPSLVKYGALFVETAKVPCTNPHSDGGADQCDPDGGPVDGPK